MSPSGILPHAVDLFHNSGFTEPLRHGGVRFDSVIACLSTERKHSALNGAERLAERQFELTENTMTKAAQQKATIYDVAELAGVSLKTVSRVINKEPNVRETTKEKVRKAIARLKYQPSPSARGLAGSKSFLIGLLYSNPSSSYITEAQRGALRSCGEEGFGLLIQPCDFQSSSLIEDLLAQLKQARVDGVILTPPLSDNAELQQSLTREAIGYVCVAPLETKQGVTSVSCDDEKAAAEITEYLLAQGHTQIAHILGHPDHSVSTLRYQGYARAMQARGLEPLENHVCQGQFDFQSGKQCAHQLLDFEQPPTAIFASSDDMACGVLVAAHERGIKIPQQLSVVGFDDSPLSCQTWPALSTARQPISEMASIAATLLIKQLRKQPLESPEQLLSCDLILRDSAGPAPIS